LHKSWLRMYSISRLNKWHHETLKVLETFKIFDRFCTVPNRETLYQAWMNLCVPGDHIPVDNNIIDVLDCD
jgi:hypothetical protein